MDAGKAKFLLPSPNFGKKQDEASKAKPLYLTPSGMTLLTRDKQPPPMYGARGATVPPKFMHEHGRRPKEVHNQQQPHAPQPQPQVNVVAPPEPQYCKACDMTLQTPDDIKRHRSQHEQCPADGCTFYGLASVMDKHVTAEHSTGLYDNVKKLSTPEEIAAWREERKKKYPTLANIELKQRAREQRQRRGERLEACRERFGKHEDRRRAQHTEKPQDEERGDNRGNAEGRGDRRNDRKRKRRRSNADHKGEKVAKTENSVKTDKKESTEVRSVVQRELEENLCDGVPAFRGTAGMKDYKHFKAKPKNVLSSLVGMYGSDDDDDEDDESDDDDCEEVAKGTGEKETQNEETRDEKTQEEEENHEPMVAEIVPEIIEEPEIVEEPEIIEEPSIEANVAPTPPQECIKDDEEPPPDQNGSSDEGPDEAPISHKSLQPDLPEPKPPAAVNTPQESTKKPEKPTKRPPPRKITRTTGLNYRLLRLKNQNTMLEKLLEPDVRHERNVLLQCVRFVCENKFFGIGQASGGDQK